TCHSEIRWCIVLYVGPVGVRLFDVSWDVLLPFLLNVPVEIQIEFPLHNFPDFWVCDKLLPDRHAISTVSTKSWNIPLRVGLELLLVVVGSKDVRHALKDGLVKPTSPH